MESGVIVQSLDGPRKAITPEEAKKRLKAISPDKKWLYEQESLKKE